MFQESFPLTDKTCFLYGNPQSSHLLIQPVGAQDLSGGLEKEVACLKKMAGEDFLLAAFEIRNWNQELSPWEAPPVWGTEAFGNGAAETLDFILRNLLPELKNGRQLFHTPCKPLRGPFFRVLEMSAGIPFQGAGEKKMSSGRLFLRLWMVKLFCAG